MNPGHLLAIDPDSNPKDRGFSAWSPLGERLAYGRDPLNFLALLPSQGFDTIAVEAQYPNPKSSRQSLITLGNYAGFLLGRAPALRYLMIPVAVWKNRLIPGFANAPKHMYTAQLRKRWPEVRPERGTAKKDPANGPLDAIGLGASFFARGGYSEAQFKEWEMV